MQNKTIANAAAAYAKFEKDFEESGLKLSFRQFVALFFAIAVFTAFSIAFVIELIPGGGGRSASIVSFAGFLAVLSLVIAIPISLRNGRIQKIEENLPDALKHMAMVLKAGGTVENSLEEVSRSDYGPLSEMLRNALDQMQHGKTFEQVLKETATGSGSKLFRRCATIINDAKRAGAGIADVTHAIADDARESTRIARERVSRTTMHVLFIYTATLFLSPFIFGFTITITSFIGTGIACAIPDSQEVNLDFLNTVLLVFLLVESIIAIVAIGIIREGRPLKYIVRIPIAILISLAVYEMGKRFGILIIGGQGCG